MNVVYKVRDQVLKSWVGTKWKQIVVDGWYGILAQWGMGGVYVIRFKNPTKGGKITTVETN